MQSTPYSSAHAAAAADASSAPTSPAENVYAQHHGVPRAIRAAVAMGDPTMNAAHSWSTARHRSTMHAALSEDGSQSSSTPTPGVVAQAGPSRYPNGMVMPDDMAAYQAAFARGGAVSGYLPAAAQYPYTHPAQYGNNGNMTSIPASQPMPSTSLSRGQHNPSILCP
jgi:hypothetical protein